MTDIKLLALDLDGTLLNADKKISKRNREAIFAARAKGVKVVLTTGRPLKAMEYLLDELGTAGLADEYTITFNGGLVQRNSGQILDKIVFSREDVMRIFRETKRLNLPLDAISDDLVYQLTSAQTSLYRKFNPYLQFQSISIEELSDQKTYNKCVTATAPESIDDTLPLISPDLFDQYEVFKSRDMLLEWSPKHVHKANGLAKLAQYLGIEANQVMACGDEENDRSMLEWSGIGVAMGNATVAIKQVANVVAPMTNDEDAVAWAIETYIL